MAVAERANQDIYDDFKLKITVWFIQEQFSTLIVEVLIVSIDVFSIFI